MPSRNGVSLSEFRQTVQRRVGSTKSLLAKFQSFCQKSDRHNMIELLMGIEEVKGLRVAESYREKNEEEALKIYEKYRCIVARDNETRGTYLAVSFLTRALFAASPERALFKEILQERAECWYTIRAFARCAKDCDYLTHVLTQETVPIDSSDESKIIVERKNKCSELRKKCNANLRRSNAESRSRYDKSSFAKLPKLDGKQNVKLASCGDCVALRYDETRGRHLVATRNLKIGSVIMIDEPFSFSTDFQALRTNCLHCHASLDLDDNVRIPCHNCQTVAYCSNLCRRDSWLEYHRYECEIFDYFYEHDNAHGAEPSSRHQQRSRLLLAWRTTLVAALDRANDRLNEKFTELQERVSEEEMGTRENDLSIDPYDPKDYRTVFALETHSTDSSYVINLARSLNAVFLAKCLDPVLSKCVSTASTSYDRSQSFVTSFAIGMLRHMQAVDCNAYEIVENRRDEISRVWEPRNVGGAIYTTVSLINHACHPNVVRHSYPDGRVVVRTLRFVSKGAEILDCYGPHFVSDSRASRQRYLQDKYHFACACEACANDFRLADDTSVVYKCPNCDSSINETANKCVTCNRTIDAKKLHSQLNRSTKKRLTAVAKMYEGNYTEALPVLIEHGTLLDKIFAVPCLEAIKTQQSIVQCWNSFSSISPFIRSSA